MASEGFEEVYTRVEVHGVWAFCHRPSAPQPHVNFNFSCFPHYSYWATLPNSTDERLVYEVNVPSLETSIHVDRQQVLSYEEACEIIGRELGNWPVRSRSRQKLIDLTLEKAREAVVAMPAKYNVVRLNVRVDATHKRILSQRGVIDWMIRRSVREHEPCMVPTKESQIELLESKKVPSVEVSGMTCSVCLEEFVVEDSEELLCMPCSHVFHGDCIKKWLRTSHYCPLCRFEMPTN